MQRWGWDNGPPGRDVTERQSADETAISEELREQKNKKMTPDTKH